MDEPIRVLHVIGIMNRGGAETMIMNLYRNIDRTKIQFDFVENEGKKAAFDDEIFALGGKIYHCPRYEGKNHFTYVRWWNNFFDSHKNEYRIVHGHIGSTAAIYLSIAKKRGLYCIAHSHNTNTMKNFSDIIYAMFAYPTRFVADHFFSCSKEAGISRYGAKIGNDERRCSVLPNAIDVNRFTFDVELRQRMRNSLGLNDTQLVVGNVSRFSKQKNHSFILNIFEKIHDISPHATLLLIGDGELRSQIEETIAKKGLQNSVILTGIKSDVWNYYQAMDVFLMPSFYEGLPVSMVEAQAAGIPCIVSTNVPRESAITDLVQFISLNDGIDIWRDCIIKSAQMPRRNMFDKIRETGFDIKSTADWLKNYYIDVVRNYEQ